MMLTRCFLLLMPAIFSTACEAADFSNGPVAYIPAERSISSIKGRASVLSGDTLWFPNAGIRVGLAGVASCALPQWAFDPSTKGGRHLKPVPCGPFARAWLKRAIGNAAVTCRAVLSPAGSDVKARCEVKGRDLAYEMLKVGWARVDGYGIADPQYAAAERFARSARYGLWGTYVLDPNEWQARAVDRTMDRRPVADRNLLQDRQREITPAFTDWRNRPHRTDR